MAHRTWKLTGVLLVLTVALSGCGLGAPKQPSPTAACSAAISKQAADQLMQRIGALGSSGKTFTLTATNDEVTSVLNQILDQAKQESGGAPIPIQNPIVCFKSGKTIVSGKVDVFGVNADALVTISATVNSGKASFRVEQVALGSFGVPKELTTGLSDTISEALNQGTSEIQFTEIQMQEGQVKVSGRMP